MKIFRSSGSLVIALAAVAFGALGAYAWRHSLSTKQVASNNRVAEMRSRRAASAQLVDNAQAIAASGKVPQSAMLLDQAAKLDTTWAVPHLRRADLLGALNRPEEARRELEEAIRLDPDGLETLIARIRNPAPGTPPTETLKLARKAALQSLSPETLYLLAHAINDTGDAALLSEAANNLQAAYLATPEDPRIALELARTYTLRNQRTEAAQFYALAWQTWNNNAPPYLAPGSWIAEGSRDPSAPQEPQKGYQAPIK